MRKGIFYSLLHFTNFFNPELTLQQTFSIFIPNTIILNKKYPVLTVSTAVPAILFLLILIITGIYIRHKFRFNELLISSLQSELQKKENMLAERNTEKEWLMGEINHRVRNNLQIISSLFSTQSAYLGGQNVQKTIKSTERRLYTISLAYHSLYQSELLSKVNLQQYVGSLLDYLKDEYNLNENIQFDAGIEEVYLRIETTVPLGLIIYEAVSNAIKFAFPHSGKGKIKIAVKQLDDERFILAISDNGVGLPKSFDPAEASTLGTNLIIGLGRQLGGECQLIGENGLSLTLKFANIDEGK
ncbi:sensor histidine kinase [Mucilaginibacter psychrotolerans]|uniref:histidine kinase n=1 Tax=Mucilaginibacter psychrotolerans TaxID=1524096 RepID=A0A4Y8SGY5_9SPHI|nr:sensor histidine kinase [Mucilaginibacter psychrotolerans]TFF37787.1 sensor histidine kinase [Mucilaginibacter psychrotolerans]